MFPSINDKEILQGKKNKNIKRGKHLNIKEKNKIISGIYISRIVTLWRIRLKSYKRKIINKEKFEIKE